MCANRENWGENGSDPGRLRIAGSGFFPFRVRKNLAPSRGNVKLSIFFVPGPREQSRARKTAARQDVVQKSDRTSTYCTENGRDLDEICTCWDTELLTREEFSCCLTSLPYLQETGTS